MKWIQGNFTLKTPENDPGEYILLGVYFCDSKGEKQTHHARMTRNNNEY